MSNVLYKQEEKTFLFHNRSVCSNGSDIDRIKWWIVNRPTFSDEQIGFQIFRGSHTVLNGAKNPRLIQLEKRIALERQNIVAKTTTTKPKAKPIRSRPIKKASTNGTKTKTR